MQLAYFFGTVIAVTAILVTAMLLMLRWSKNLMERMLTILQTLTNLAASKDLTAFQSLQATTNHQSAPEQSEQILALDDEAMARYLANEYQAKGLDPGMAFNREDDVDFRAEFGI